MCSVAQMQADDGDSRWVSVLPRDNINFRWLFGEWTLEGHYGNGIAPSMPNLTLWKAKRRPDGELDYGKCVERLTPFDKEFSVVLRGVLADVEKGRLDA